MTRWLASWPLMLLVARPLAAQAPVLEKVLQAELAFARLAEQKGIRTAFRTWLVEDARVFAPRPTTALTQYAPEPGDPGQLAWYPEAMGLARSGELAWSFGPWTYAPNKGEPVLVQGHFLSLWRRQEHGQWKVEADIGVPHARPAGPIDPFRPGKEPTAGMGPISKAAEATLALRRAETALAAAWEARGGSALLPEMAKGGRILRPKLLPAQSLAEIQQALAGDLPGSTWFPERIQVAASGDLGWTWGESGPGKGSATASFLRIWTLEAGIWKVLFDVRLPYPAPVR